MEFRDCLVCTVSLVWNRLLAHEWCWIFDVRSSSTRQLCSKFQSSFSIELLLLVSFTFGVKLMWKISVCVHLQLSSCNLFSSCLIYKWCVNETFCCSEEKYEMEKEIDIFFSRLLRSASLVTMIRKGRGNRQYKKWKTIWKSWRGSEQPLEFNPLLEAYDLKFFRFLFNTLF